MIDRVINTNLCDRSNWLIDDIVSEVIADNIKIYYKVVSSLRGSFDYNFLCDEALFYYLRACYAYVYKNPNSFMISSFIRMAVTQAKKDITLKLQVKRNRELYFADIQPKSYEEGGV